MKTQRGRNVSKDRLTITRSNTRSKKNAENGRRENSLPIPIDLIMEIFSRLSAKSIARCLCVSKPWASLLRRSDFTELFFKRSSARPQLLFACPSDGKLLFFSSPQPQNPDENSSSHVVASYHSKISFDHVYSRVCGHVHGLVLYTNRQISKGKEEIMPVIYNPSTSQSLLLPKVETTRKSVYVFTMLGYDPIDKQYKLLSMTYGKENMVHEEHQVLTLGTGNDTWRMIKCCKPHCSLERGICIDGVLYYTASDHLFFGDSSMVVSFDVRSEKFIFIQVAETFRRGFVPINYNGKLGLFASESSCWVHGSTRSIELHVLEDSQKQEWSKHKYVLPALWKNIVGNTHLYFVGMTRINEIVLAAHVQTVPFYIFYYNIERKTAIKLQIKGMEAFKYNRLNIILDHVENLKLM